MEFRAQHFRVSAQCDTELAGKLCCDTTDEFVDFCKMRLNLFRNSMIRTWWTKYFNASRFGTHLNAFGSFLALYYTLNMHKGTPSDSKSTMGYRCFFFHTVRLRGYNEYRSTSLPVTERRGVVVARFKTSVSSG